MSAPPVALALDGYSLSPILTEEADELQRLFERCDEYFELQEGAPAAPDAAAHDLADLPPGKLASDKYALGLRNPAGELVGYVDLVRDYPGEGVWWLGLLLLAPELRNRGLGARIFDALADRAAREGARSIRLGVLEQNEAAARFWRRRGFQTLSKGTFTARSGRASAVTIMHLALRGTEG